MAWLWKQGRPTLLAVVGLGLLGYKALHKEREPMEQEQTGVSGRGVATARPLLTTSAPAATSTKPSFLGGLGIIELATRVVKEVREDDCLGWAAQLAYYLLFAVFPFFLFLTALLGFLPIPNLMERIIGGLAMVLPGEAVTAPPGQYPAARDGAERRAAVLRDSGRTVVLLQCRGGHHGGAEPGL